MLHDVLWRLNKDLAHACLQHSFVKGLADGTLDRAVFGRYVAQDAFFLQAFLRAYALAVAKCTDVELAREFSELMRGVLDELKLHRVYAAKLEIDLVDVRPYPTVKAYTDFLLRTAWHAELGHIVAAMTPCMRLYRFLGTELAASLRSGHPYQQWIATYSSDEFGALTDQLESLLDSSATDAPMVRETYRYAMRCELDFFSAPQGAG